MNQNPASVRESDYRARYYDATIERFASEDPIKFWGGNNFYRYVQNSAANFTDPFGLTDYNQQQTLQLFLQPAYSDATAGYFKGLWKIGNHSTGQGDFDFAHNDHAGDTFNVCGQQISAGDFGNFIAGFQGAAWDHKYDWRWFLSPILVPPGFATNTAIVAGQYYHVKGDTDVPNDPLDATGIPWILRGAVAGWNFPKDNRKCGCE
jgi:RHS repeat-associated protein